MDDIKWSNEYFYVTPIEGRRTGRKLFVVRDALTRNIMNQKRYETSEQAIHAAKGMTRRRNNRIEKILLGK